MDTKTLGSWLIGLGILFLIGYSFYELFQASDFPLVLKISIGVILLGVLVFIPSLLKEVKKDKVVIK